jgi:hypothetical protein
MANRVIPISSSDVVDEPETKSQPVSYSGYMRDYFTDASLTIQSKLTFAYFKECLLWFLDTGKLNIAISVRLPSSAILTILLASV